MIAMLFNVAAAVASASRVAGWVAQRISRPNQIHIPGRTCSKCRRDRKGGPILHRRSGTHTAGHESGSPQATVGGKPTESFVDTVLSERRKCGETRVAKTQACTAGAHGTPRVAVWRTTALHRGI